jgi:hypothetical protein
LNVAFSNRVRKQLDKAASLGAPLGMGCIAPFIIAVG